MTALGDAVERLLGEHGRIGSPLGRYLRTGPPETTVRDRLEPLGIAVSPEIVEWFGRLGAIDDERFRADRGGASGALGLYPNGYPVDLDDAVSSHARLLEGARSMETSTAGELRAEDYWRPAWLPVLGSEPYWIALDTGDGGAVWRVNWEPDYADETVPICPTLAAFVDAAVAAFRRGEYAWDEVGGQLAMADGDRVPEPPVCAPGQA